MLCHLVVNANAKKGKGREKSTLKDVNFETYTNVLKSGSFLRHSMGSIVSKKHELETVIQNKITLSCFSKVIVTFY